MIPLRISVKGLLCYRGEQELNLADSPIWMLSGPNGSGKSAVFDAVTFVLFGCHRGGKANARELINKHEDGLAVELDFLLDGDRFRLRRTASRKATGTRQISRWLGGSDPSGNWEAVSGTESDRGFEQWIREHIGLTYESFTSSVLLLQGQAERVLSPRPSDRREILESVVDLNRYKRLHARVDEARKHLQAQGSTLRKQLQGIPPVSDSELAAARSQLAGCEQARHDAREKLDRLRGLRSQSEEWARVEASLVANRRSIQRADMLVAEASGIRSGWQRLQELRAVIPPMKAVADQRSRLAAAEGAMADLKRDEDRLTKQITELEARRAESLQHRQSMERELAADGQRLEAISSELRTLSELVGRSSVCQRQSEELKELKRQLALYPPDAAETLWRTQREYDELLIVREQIPPLTRLYSEREALHEVTLRLNEAVETVRRLADQVQELPTECAEIGRRAEAAIIARRNADRKATEIRTLRDQAARRVQAFDEVAEQTICSQCGQMLTANHVEAERGRLSANLMVMNAEMVSATDSLTAAEQLEQQLLEEKNSVESLLAKLREQLNEAGQNLNSYRRDHEKYCDACRSIYENELDGVTRQRVGWQLSVDWLSTSFPTKDELEQMQQQVNRIGTVQESLSLAKSTFDEVRRLHERAEFIGESIAAQHLEFSSDPASIRCEHERLLAEETELKQNLSKCRRQLESENKTVDSLTLLCNAAQREVSAKQAEICATSDLRIEAQTRLTEAVHGLVPDWQASAQSITVAEVHNLQTELMQLCEQDLETRYTQLLQAEANAYILRETIAELERQCSEFPAEARKPVAEFEQSFSTAKGQVATYDKAVQDAQISADRLALRHSQRQQLLDEYLSVSKQHRLCETLAELLGPARLQREVVRRAEREIVDLANAMLDRVSGGQLELTLAGQNATAAEGHGHPVFQLEARNRTTAAQPLGVAFLSGSQRFRVAVSLALALGQYASARRRSVQSVIIDEGFGSLDREGRQVMIQELQNLRGLLERIVLVSHQEEFADAFPDGYRFELINGSTQVSRIHR